MARTRLPNEVRDAVHLFLAFRDESFKAIGIVDQTSFRLVRSEIHEFSQHGTSRRKQFGMISRASLVPIAEWFPFLAVWSGTENIALGRQDEIRTNRQGELGETFLKQIDRASRVDRPDRATILQLATQLHTSRVEHRFGSTRNKRPIKIETEPPKWLTHSKPI